MHPQPVQPSDLSALRDRLMQHVDVLARVIGDRNVSTRYAALESAARYIETTFTQLGYEPAAQIYRVNGVDVRNIEVESKGEHKPDQIIVIGAHYDSVPGCPAANDN